MSDALPGTLHISILRPFFYKYSLLIRGYRPKDTAEDCAEDMDVLTIVPMSPSPLQGFKTSLKQDELPRNALQASKNEWPNCSQITERMELFSPIRDELAV